MEPNTATMNLKEFTYGILNGLMERNFKPEGVASIKENKAMIKNRERRLELMYGKHHASEEKKED